MRFIFIGFFLLFFSACSSLKTDDYLTYKPNENKSNLLPNQFVIDLKQNEPVDVRGIYTSDNSIQKSDIPYSGGAIEILAEISLDMAMSHHSQKSKLSAQQEQANQILVPYQSELSQCSQKSLKPNEYTFLESNSPNLDIILSSYPIFFISQDFKSIALKHVIHANKRADQSLVYQNIIEVVTPFVGNDVAPNTASLLCNAFKQLYKESLQIVFLDLQGKYKTQPKEETFKFVQGDYLRVERGYLLNDQQNKILLRNLRGWVISYQKALSNLESAPNQVVHAEAY